MFVTKNRKSCPGSINGEKIVRIACAVSRQLCIFCVGFCESIVLKTFY